MKHTNIWPMGTLLKSRNPHNDLNGPVSTLYSLKAYEIAYSKVLNIPMVLSIKLVMFGLI